MECFFFFNQNKSSELCDNPNDYVLLAFKQLEEDYKETLKYVTQRTKTNQSSST